LHGFDPRDPAFWDAGQLSAELQRQLDVCHGCRMCFSYCPSFPALFEAIDTHEKKGEGETAALTQAEIDRTVDLCFQCKLCYVKCPYTPPHEWRMDIPGLFLRQKAVRTRARGGMPRQDRALSDPDKLGRLGSAMPRLTNWTSQNRAARALMESWLGIHRDRNLPIYRAPSFMNWFAQRPRPQTGGVRVALFATCSVNYNEPDIGGAAVQVLEKNGLVVEAVYEACCGMPNLDGGDLDGAVRKLRANLETLAPLARAGVPILVLQATCGYVLKVELPKLVPGPDAELVAAKTFDVCEWLWQLHLQKKLDTGFPQAQGKIAYHAPCHLRAQNVGYRSRDLLALIPGTEVELVEKCSAFDGTWGMKKEFYPLSKKYAKKLVTALGDGEPAQIASDCVLAGLNVAQAIGRAPRHPVQIMRDAYGMTPEWQA